MTDQQIAREYNEVKKMVADLGFELRGENNLFRIRDPEMPSVVASGLETMREVRQWVDGYKTGRLTCG